MTTNVNESSSKRLLIVDDDESPRESLRIIFCSNYDVTIASSGEEAIELSRAVPFGVVITDIRMRGLSGIDVLRELKKVNSKTEVIVLTAFETLETARQAINLGASDYLKKPFDAEHIQRVVSNCYANYLAATSRDELIRADVNAAKNNFLDILSHELNTPINGVLGFIELLQDTQLNKDQADFVEIIRDCSWKYYEHIQDILNYAKLPMAQGELSETSFNPATVLIKLVKEEMKKSKVHIDLEIPQDLPQYVTGAESEIRVVLCKLVQNAAKFAAQATIGVSMNFERLGGRNLRLIFNVWDTGPGIASEYLADGKIFDPFTQEDASWTRSQDGLGLGLALSQGLAKRLGGSLEVKSELGNGSQFTFAVSVSVEEL